MTFESIQATAVDRERGIEVVQPRLERGAGAGEVEMQYSVYFGGRVEVICCLATVDERADDSQVWEIHLGPRHLIASLMRIQRAMSYDTPSFEFLKDMADAMTLVYAEGYDIYAPTKFTVVATERELAECGVAVPSNATLPSGWVVMGERSVNVSFEALPVLPEAPASAAQPLSLLVDRDGPAEYVFASGRLPDGSSNIQRAFDFIASQGGNAGTLFHTPLGRAIDNARSAHDITSATEKMRAFFQEQGMRPFLGKYRNLAVDMMINNGCRDFATSAVESGACIAFVDGYLPHSRFAHAELPILQSATNLRVSTPST